MANLASFLILLLFLFGRSLYRKNLTWHIRLMLTAFVADVILILALVFGRQALSKVGPDMSTLLMVHVSIAISTVVLYVLTIRAGYRLYKGDKAARARLKILDKILVTARVFTLVTSLILEYAG
ncbi:MAG: hypothetical protein AB7F86_04755 [Bdellovibrionales bacterium]